MNGADERLAASPDCPTSAEGQNILKCAQNDARFYEICRRPKVVKNASLVHASLHISQFQICNQIGFTVLSSAKILLLTMHHSLVSFLGAHHIELMFCRDKIQQMCKYVSSLAIEMTTSSLVDRTHG